MSTAPTGQPAPERPRRRRLLGFYITRAPKRSRDQGDNRLGILAGAAALMIAFHELIYRETPGPREFPLLGILSHPASDMILLSFGLLLTVAILYRRDP